MVMFLMDPSQRLMRCIVQTLNFSLFGSAIPVGLITPSD